MTLFLRVIIGLFKLDLPDFREVFITALICTILITVFLFGGLIILIVAFFICSIVIKFRHELKFGYAILVTIFVLTLGFMIIMLLVILISATLGIEIYVPPF